MERRARAAGARFDVRDGWNVAVAYPGEPPHSVTWADRSHLGKLEVHGEHGLTLGTAEREGETWLCPLTRMRALAICPPGEAAAWRAARAGGGGGPTPHPAPRLP